MTARLVLICAVAMVLGAAPSLSAFAATTSAGSNFFVLTDKQSYTGDATIFVSGVAPSGSSAVTVQIENPKFLAIAATPLGINQTNGFSTSFQAGGAAWNATGKYTVVVVVQQLDNTAAPPTTNSTFTYTAVASTVTSSSATTSTSSTAAPGGGGLSLEGVLALVVFVVIASGLVALMLRLRRRAAAGPSTAK